MIDDIGAHQYQLFCQFLENACGIVLGDSKQYLVRSRLSPLVNAKQNSNLNEFIDLVIKGDIHACKAAIEVMTTNETLWFRDRYPFQLLENELFPELVAKHSSIRVWSAACSSGQEVYSIGMNWLNFKKTVGASSHSKISIIGTDISADMVDICQKGEYDSLSTSRGLPIQCQQDYFYPLPDGRLKVKPELSVLTQFKGLNLLSSYAGMGQFNLIFCRNVLIYFSAEIKKQILQKIAACLQEGGILFLGASESIADLTDLFILKRGSTGLYYQKKPRS